MRSLLLALAPDNRGRLVALLVVASVLFAGLGSPTGGTHPDEGLYLQAAREMHDRGDWLTPTVDGRPDFTKPPLLYWTMGACFAVFGETLWAARLPIALAALALAWVTGRLARGAAGPEAEPLAIVVLGTCLGLLRYARVDLMDVPLALALAVGIWTCWRVAEGAPMRLLLVTGLAAGAATLLKGPVGTLLMAAPAAAYLARRRKLVPALPWLAASAVVALVLAAPWYLAMANRYGEPFVLRFFGTENVGKFRFPWTIEGELSLLLALPVLLLPWTPLIRLRGPGASLAWPWVAGLLVLYSLPGLKHPHYVVPALAPLAVLASGPRPGAGRLASAALILTVGVAGALALRFPLAGPVRLGLGCMVLLLVAAAILLARGGVMAGAVAFAGAAVLLFGSVLPGAVPSPVPAWVAERAGSRPLFTATQNPGLYSFLLGRTVHRASGEGPILQALEQGQALLVTRDERAGLPPAVTARLRPLATWPRLRGRLPVGEVVNAWLRADTSELFERMSLEVLKTPDSH